MKRGRKSIFLQGKDKTFNFHAHLIENNNIFEFGKIYALLKMCSGGSYTGATGAGPH